MPSIFQSHAHKRKREFEWREKLGAGAYGEVTKCLWKTRQPPVLVAMKVVPKSKIIRPKDAHVRGLELLKSLRHDHVIKVYDWWESRNNWYVALELANGGELYDKLEQSTRFEELHVKAIMRDLVDAIQYLHSRRVLHRDLKLENIFVRNSKQPFNCVIADFGVCKYFDEAESTEDHGLTEVIGSAGYCAPEIVSQSGYGMEADLWSLGVVAFLLLAGRFPFRAVIGPKYLEHIDQGLKFPSKPWKQISAEAKDFCRILLTKDPLERATPKEALAHPWLTTTSVKAIPDGTLNGKLENGTAGADEETGDAAEAVRRVPTTSTVHSRIH